MRHQVGEDVRVKHHNHADNRTQRDGVPEDKSEDNPFVAHLFGRGCGNRNGLCIHHFPHHATGAVGRTHENWVNTQLL